MDLSDRRPAPGWRNLPVFYGLHASCARKVLAAARGGHTGARLAVLVRERRTSMRKFLIAGVSCLVLGLSGAAFAAGSAGSTGGNSSGGTTAGSKSTTTTSGATTGEQGL